MTAPFASIYGGRGAEVILDVAARVTRRGVRLRTNTSPPARIFVAAKASVLERRRNALVNVHRAPRHPAPLSAPPRFACSETARPPLRMVLKLRSMLRAP